MMLWKKDLEIAGEGQRADYPVLPALDVFKGSGRVGQKAKMKIVEGNKAGRIQPFQTTV